MKHRIFSFLLALVATFTLCAAPADTVVSLLTAYPGKEVYQLAGHTALRVRTPDGRDMSINYGVFDFAAPNFLYRFVKGETDYMMGVYPTRVFMYEYLAEGRRVEEQVLSLTPEEKKALMEATIENYRPENRTYRYNYVLDNCATRPLRLIEASGDTVTFKPHGAQLPWHTFREAMYHYHERYPWYQLGIDLALGPGIDYPIDLRQKTFAPLALHTLLSDATVKGRPLVTETRVLNDLPPDNALPSATPWYLTPLCVFVIILALGVWLSVRDMARHSLTRWFDSVVYGVFGLAGCLLTFLVFVSVHEATSPNWLLLWLNPLCLFPAVAVWVKGAKRLVFWYFLLNFALILLMCVLWPLTGQWLNVAFVPLIVLDVMRSAVHISLYRHHRRQSAKTA